MQKIITYFLFLFGFLFLFQSCQKSEKASKIQPTKQVPQGKLFIIGGGKRPPALLNDLVKTSEIDKQGYGIILPMSSSEPDSAAYYAIKQFTEIGLAAEKFQSLQITKDNFNQTMLDSVANAQLIYLTGGDQRKFMELVAGTGLSEIIQTAYQNGATIAGTSAGAALMSQNMITGDERKHPEYTGDFRTIEADNLIMQPGLALLKNAIIDQHFIYRMRMNRLVTVALEYPEQIAIGIDEATAIVVEGNQFRVTGEGQVVVLRNSHKSKIVSEGLLGGNDLQLSVLLPKEKYEF